MTIHTLPELSGFSKWTSCCLSGKSLKEKGISVNLGSLKGNVSLYQVDGCLITDKNIKKVDIVGSRTFTPNNKLDMIFIELKGADVRRALSQIESTMKQKIIIDTFRALASKSIDKHAFIISKTAAISYSFQKEKSRAEGRLGFSIQIRRERHYTITESDLKN